MNFTKEEKEKTLFSCSICYYEYDTTTRIPKELGCGHNLCSLCVAKMFYAHKPPKCPLCKVAFRPLTEIKTNFTLLPIIELREKAKANICKVHKKYECDFYCVNDKVKICIECKISEAHKDHDIRTLDEINDKALVEAKKSEEMLEKFDRHEKGIQKLYNETMQKIEAQIHNQFTSIQDKMHTDKRQLLARVKNFINAKMSEKENLESSRKKIKLEDKISILKRGQINDEFITHLQSEEINLQQQYFESEIKATEDQCNKLSNHILTKLDDLQNNIFTGLDQFEPIPLKIKPAQANSIVEEWKLYDQINPPKLLQRETNKSDCQEKVYMREVGSFSREGDNYRVYMWKQNGRNITKHSLDKPSYRDFPGHVLSYYTQIIYETNVPPKANEKDFNYFNRVDMLHRKQMKREQQR